MRNQALTGYVLHQKPYQDNRSLTYFFSEELGLINGIGKKNLPNFNQISLFASGKSGLKTFSQSQLTDFTDLAGPALYAGWYVNELLLKVLEPEEPVIALWQAYQRCLHQLNRLSTATLLLAGSDKELLSVQLRLLLRRFEMVLLDELGYGIDFCHDSQGEKIIAKQVYRYQLQQGFVPVMVYDDEPRSNANFVQLTGSQIGAWQITSGMSDIVIQTNPVIQGNPMMPDSHLAQSANLSGSSLQDLSTLLIPISQLFRQVIDHLINYEALHSRELWRQFQQYQQQ